MLGHDTVERLRKDFRNTVGFDRGDLDLSNIGMIEQKVTDVRPDVIVNCAAYTNVDLAEKEPELAFKLNRDVPGVLASIAEKAHITLIHISTDYVFDGKTTRPYREEDVGSPINLYGRSKWEGEELIRARLRKHIILRTSWLYGIRGKNFVKTMVRLAEEKEELCVVSDQYGSPTWSRDLAHAIGKIVMDISQYGKVTWGTYHYSGLGETSWHGFAEVIVELLKKILEEKGRANKLKVIRISPIPTEVYPTPARRPRRSTLNCEKIQRNFGIEPRPWQASLEAMLRGYYG